MKIYTKTGDNGSTMLFGGGRVPKHHLRIEAYGTVDELNTYLGLVADGITDELPNEYRFLLDIQKQLFTLGAMLATNPNKKNAKTPVLTSECVLQLETKIDHYTNELPALKHFILPGGQIIASYCQIARTVCRRAERRIIALNEQEQVASICLQYINRLSDYLFVLSRFIVLKMNGKEIKWLP